ncbi:MAG: hypothetical protein ABW195_14680, partial [Ilumatobacteraceae bacterium]
RGCAAAARPRRGAMGRRRAAATTTAIPEPGSAAFRSWASDLAHDVAEHGLAGVERAVTDVCASACRRGLEATCVEIVADRTQPPVARERALGHILMTLASWSPTTIATSSDVA